MVKMQQVIIHFIFVSYYNLLRTDHVSALYQIQHGVDAGYVASQERFWKEWCTFCRSIWQDPLLKDSDDPKLLLSIFATRVRDGRCAPGGAPVKAGSVSTALRAVGQKFAFMGAPDPRLDDYGRIDRRLKRQLDYMEKADPPPARLKPIPLSIPVSYTHLTLPTICSV